MTETSAALKLRNKKRNTCMGSDTIVKGIVIIRMRSSSCKDCSLLSPIGRHGSRFAIRIIVLGDERGADFG